MFGRAGAGTRRARWRSCASRGGRKVPPPIQRMRADDLLAAVFPDQAACAENLAGEIRIPDHPLVNETIAQLPARGDGPRRPQARARAHRRRARSRPSRSTRPSRRRSRTRSSTPIRTPSSTMRRSKSAARARCSAPHACRPTMRDGAGALDPAAIAQVAAEAWPPCAMPTSCTMRCSTLIVLPARRSGSRSSSELVDAGRATTLDRRRPRFLGRRRAARPRALRLSRCAIDPPIERRRTTRAMPEAARLRRRDPARLARMRPAR